MRQVHAEIKLVSGEDMIHVRRGRLTMDKVKSIPVAALVDRSFPYMAINDKIQEYLQLWLVDRRPFRMTDGECDAIVLPGDAEPVLGLVVNPKHPDYSVRRL